MPCPWWCRSRKKVRMRSRRELWWCCGDDILVVEGRCLGERERERERERRERREKER